jgi:tetratricopeptide (TPR) repeat protein
MMPRCAGWMIVAIVALSGVDGALGQSLDDVKRELLVFKKLVDQRDWPKAERQAQRMLTMAEIALRNKPTVLSGYYNVLGKLYGIQSRYDLAEPLFLRALQLNEQGYGHWHAKVADDLHELAEALYYQDKFGEAASRYRQALEIRQKVLGANHLDTARSWRELAWSFDKNGEPEKAIPCFQQALAIRERRLGGEAPLVAETLNELADVLYFQCRHEEALALYDRALSIRRKAFGENDARVADALVDRGECLQQMYRLPEAESALRRAVEIRTGKLGAEATETATAMRALGSVLIDMSRLDEAEELFKRALATEERAWGPNHLSVAKSLGALAHIRREQGRYAEAEPLYQRSLAIREQLQPPDELSVAVACDNLASLYSDQGRYAEAERLYRRALALRERHLAEDDPGIATNLNNLGALLRNQGRNREAEPLYRRALAIRQQRLPADHPDVATSLRNLANLYSSLGQYDEAEPLYMQSLKIVRKVYGPDHAEVAGCESAIADLYWNQGRHDDAIQLYESTLRKFEASLGPAHPDLAAYLYDLAWAYFDRDRSTEAQTLLDRAVDIDRQFPLVPQTAFNVYYFRARVSRHLGHKSEAQRDLARAMELAEKLRGASAGAELERAEFFANFAGAFEKMVHWQTEDGDVERALDAIERSRARSLLDEIGLLGADLEAGRPAIEEEQFRQQAAELRARLAQLETALQQHLQQGESSAAAHAQRQRLQEEITRVREQLYRQYRDARASSMVYQNLLGRNMQIPSLGEIQRHLLDDASLLLVYLLGKEHGYVVAITAADARLFLLDVPEWAANVLGCEVGSLTDQQLQHILLAEGGVMRELSRPQVAAELKSRLSALWQVLIPAEYRKPILEKKFSRLYVVPHGALAFLPLEALITAEEGEGQYLLDVGQSIYYAPSVTVLDSLRIRLTVALPTGREPVLSVGDPDYGPAQAAPGEDENRESRHVLLRSQLTPLPYSGLESRWVSDVFGRAGLSTLSLTKQQASESRVRQAARARKFVHLACHGFADQTHGNLFGALALAPGADPETNPSNDGFLNLAEIYELDLRGCELAILSACQTNYGPQQQGEGVWTLSRGFLVAGSRRVVASNWVVDDEAAASLVSYFCAALAKAEQAAEPDPYGSALAAAKRYVRSQKKWSAPYYWASMVLIGPR